MTTSGRRPVVVGVDGSSGSGHAVTWAADVAVRHRVPIHLVHAVWLVDTPFALEPSAEGALHRAAVGAGRRLLDEAEQHLRAVVADIEITTSMPSSAPVATLVELSQDASLTVVGPTGTGGFSGMMLGSTAYAVASRAHSPVAVVRGDGAAAQRDASRDVVVAVDGSQNSEQAIAVAFAEAADLGAPLMAVHVWNGVSYDRMYGLKGLDVPWASVDAQQRRWLAESLAGWCEKYPDVKVSRSTVNGEPRKVLLDRSAAAQLIVVGSHGRGGVRRMLLGSTSHALVEHANCPVLVVRA
jgi:nucleotide-binding universal stress UspA family protein